MMHQFPQYTPLQECLCIIFHNENTTEGMNEVLRELHSYVPRQRAGDGDTLCHETGLVGDQLTVERTVNCMLSMVNAFTPDERLEGMHPEIADWHAEMNFSSVSLFLQEQQHPGRIFIERLQLIMFLMCHGMSHHIPPRKTYVIFIRTCSM